MRSPPRGRSWSRPRSPPARLPNAPCASPPKSASTPMPSSPSRTYDRRGGDARGDHQGAAREPVVKSASELTPRVIVEELDRYIVGQRAAKRAVAIALRNRWRRQQVPAELRDEIAPKNIIMIGPTGVGKTEIARRLAKLVAAPFLKVEASKFTEVGYVGRDVDSIVRDLIEISVKLVKDEEQAKVRARAKELAEEKILDLQLPQPSPSGHAIHLPAAMPSSMDASGPRFDPNAKTETGSSTREKLRELLRAGKLDER